MRFKEFLTEKPMDYRTFSGVKKRLGGTALVGFEFEMVVPTKSMLYNGVADERETQRIRWFDSIEEFKTYFQMSPLTESDIKLDFEDWVKNQRKQDDDSTFREWLKTEFKDNYDFVRRYDLYPLYGWYDETPSLASVFIEPDNADIDGDDNFTETFESAKLSLDKIVKEPVKISLKYHGSGIKDFHTWYIEPDESIKGNGHAMEVVSPPMPLTSAENVLDTIFTWMNENDLVTNESTGLHINVSVPGMDDIDLVKLVLMLGEDYAAAAFNRLNNKYALPQIERMQQKLIGRDGAALLKSTSTEMIEAAKAALARDKYHAINVTTVNRGYIEFRAVGGTGYQNKGTKIKKIMYRVVAAIESACDPQADRQEYLKKLTRLFDQAKELAQQGSLSKTTAEMIPRELHRIAKFERAGDLRDAWIVANASYEKSETKKAFVIAFIESCVYLASRFGSQLNLKEVVYLKRLMKQHDISVADIDTYFRTRVVNLTREKFQKELNV